MKKERSFKQDDVRTHAPEKERQSSTEGSERPTPAFTPLSNLHHALGNRAVQRLLAQRDGTDATELDPETVGRIDRARSGGESLDTSVQSQMGEGLGYDVSDVRVHTSSEADTLNRQLGAKAFTTGQDVFFREGAYDPNSTEGQELIAHELTHVVQ